MIVSRARTLAELFHHRWAIPLLAELHRRDGERFAVLAHKFALSRESLSQTLSYLVDWGWVRRNPGYGHPLRPEYLLTQAGEPIASHCARLFDLLCSENLTDVGLRKWPLQIVAILNGSKSPLRFGAISQSCPGLTPRALSDALKRMEAEGLIEREVTNEFPPGTHYKLGKRSVRITPTLAGLEREMMKFQRTASSRRAR